MDNCIFEDNKNSLDTGGGAKIQNILGIKVTNSQFFDNKQTQYGTAGGGIVFESFNEITGYLIIEDCQFFDNQAYYGGSVGIRQIPDVLLSNCEFTDNLATTTGAAFYYIDIIGLTIQDCIFTRNVGYFTGGGIAGLFYAQTLNTDEERIPFILIERSDFLQNKNDEQGGAMYIFSVNEVYIYDCNFDQNEASFGAAAVISLAKKFELRNNIFINNISGSGSAFMNQFGEQLIVKDCDFIDNISSDLNGGVLNLNHLGKQASILILNNLLFQGNSGIGGCLSIKSITCIYSSIINIQFIDNMDANAATGIMYFEEIQYVNFKNLEFTNNIGGFAILGIQIQDSQFDQVDVTGNTGGIKILNKGVNLSFQNILIQDSILYCGLQIIQSNNITITNSQFLNNNTPKEGAGIYAVQCDEIQIKNVNLTDNKAYQGGGLMLKNVKNSIFKNIRIQANSAGYIGGGALLQVTSNCTFENLIVTENSAIIYSGGLHLANSNEIKIKNSNFYLNEAKEGAAISSVSSEYIEIYNAQIYENKATQSGGGIFWQFSDHTYLQNVLIQLNTAGNLEGGGIYCENCKNLTLSQSKIWSNIGTGMQVYESSDINILQTSLKNHTNLANGAAFYGESVDEIFIENSIFQDHLSNIKGGALYLSGSQSLIIKGSQFLDNTLSIPEDLLAKDSLGGNFYLDDVISVEFDSVVFKNSYANYKGGCLYMNDVYQISINDSYFDNCTVNYQSNIDLLDKDYNYFTSKGGAIYLANSHQNKIRRQLASIDILFFYVANSQFSNNKAQSGGAILATQLVNQFWDITINNGNQFSNNQADYGAGIRFLGFFDEDFGDKFLNEKNHYHNNTSIMSDNQHLYFGYARNEFLKSQDSTDFSLCFSGSYLMDGGGSSCKPCFDNAICNGGYEYPYPVQGYWRNTETLESYLYCEQKPEACLGKDECLYGYRGIRCSECRTELNLVEEGVECVTCIDSSYIKLQTFGNTIFSLVLVLLSMRTIQTKVDMAIQRRILNIWDFPLLQEWQFSAIMKLFLTHTQIISLTSSFIADYPADYFVLIDYFGNPVKMVSSGLKCLFKYSEPEDYYLTKAKARILGLFIFSVTLLAIQVVIILLTLIKKISKYNLRALCVSASICMYLTIQPGVIVNAINDLQCVTVGETRYAVFDSTVLCNEGFYNNNLLPLNSFLIILMVVLVPAVLIRNLIQNRQKLENHSQMKRAYGILYLEVKHSKYYWEFISMFEKLMIILVQIVYQDYLIVKSALSVIIIMVYLMLLIMIRPFYTVSLNKVAQISAFAQIMTLLIGIGMYEDKNWFIIFGLICIVIVNCYFFYKIILILVPEKYIEMRPLLIKLAGKIKCLAFIKIKLKREVKAKVRWVCLREAVAWYFEVNKKENMGFRIKQFQENQKKLYCILKMNALFKKVKNNQFGDFMDEKAKILELKPKQQNSKLLQLYLKKWRKNTLGNDNDLNQKSISDKNEGIFQISEDEIGQLKNQHKKTGQDTQKNNKSQSKQLTQLPKIPNQSEDQQCNSSSISGDIFDQYNLTNQNSVSPKKGKQQKKFELNSDSNLQFSSDINLLESKSSNELQFISQKMEKSDKQEKIKQQNLISFPNINQDLSSVRNALLQTQQNYEDDDQQIDLNNNQNLNLNNDNQNKIDTDNGEIKGNININDNNKENENKNPLSQESKLYESRISGFSKESDQENKSGDKQKLIKNENDSNDFIVENSSSLDIQLKTIKNKKENDSQNRYSLESGKGIILTEERDLIKQSSSSIDSSIVNSPSNNILQSTWNYDPMKTHQSFKNSTKIAEQQEQLQIRQEKIKKKSSQINNIYMSQNTLKNKKKVQKFIIQDKLQDKNEIINKKQIQDLLNSENNKNNSNDNDQVQDDEQSNNKQQIDNLNQPDKQVTNDNKIMNQNKNVKIINNGKKSINSQKRVKGKVQPIKQNLVSNEINSNPDSKVSIINLDNIKHAPSINEGVDQ